MKSINLKKISKKYTLKKRKNLFFDLSSSKKHEFFALKNINLSINQGECIALIGANGSGKTTLLKILSGIVKPTSGNIKTKGRILSFLEIGAGFQEELTGRENIYLYGSMLGFSKKEVDLNFNEIVSFSSLNDFIDIKLKNYSSGMKVRLAFAVAMSHNPDIILIDEIMAVGDEEFQKRSLNKINEMKKFGKTIVFVTHDLNLIKDIANKVIYLKNGEIKRAGVPSIVIHSYLSDVIELHESKFSLNNIKNKDKIIKQEGLLEQFNQKRNLLMIQLDSLEKTVYGNQKKYSTIIVNIIDSILDLNKKECDLVNINNRKIELIEMNTYLIHKKIPYMSKNKIFAHGQKAKSYLDLIQIYNNPKKRAAKIIDFIGVVQMIPNLNLTKKKQNIKDFLMATNKSTISEYYYELCLEFTLFNEKEKNRNLFDNFKDNIVQKFSKPQIINFIFNEVKDLRLKDFDPKLEAYIISIFCEIIFEIKFELNNSQIKQLDKAIWDMLNQIIKKILILKQNYILSNSKIQLDEIEEIIDVKKQIINLRKKINKSNFIKLNNEHSIIKNIKYYNKNNVAKSEFLNNENIIIEIEFFKIPKENENLNLSIYSEENYLISELLIPIKDHILNNKIKVEIIENPFSNANYFVNTSISSKNNKVLDSKLFLSYFSITNNSKNLGSVKIKYNLK
ncbi:ABC transporter ATP-binding protein [archaeon]|nr:ABC transporter ATP-binding protein [archaeon]